MLRLYYSEDTLGKSIKDNINELASALSQFHMLGNKKQQKYTETEYIPKIVSIASNLHKLADKKDTSVSDLVALLASTDKFDNFDPRYVQDFEGRWTKEIDQKARVNQELLNIAEMYKNMPGPEERFVILSALKYIAGKDIDQFEIKSEETEDTDFDNLTEISKRSFDYLVCPFNESMNRFCSVFSGEDKKIYARFRREEFELYMLYQIYQKTASFVAEDSELAIYYVNELSKYIQEDLKTGCIYSESSIELLDNMLDSSVIASFFITGVLSNAVRTKTCLDFNGKGRNYFLSGIDIFADKMRLENVGFSSLSGIENRFSNHNINNLAIENAGERFGIFSNFNCDEIYLKHVGHWALCGTKMLFSENNIRKLTVIKSDGAFGLYSNFNSDEIYLKDVGNDVLGGHNKKFADNKIRKITVDSASNKFGEFCNFCSDEMILRSVGFVALAGSNEKIAVNNIKKLVIEKGNYGMGMYSSFNSDNIHLIDVGEWALSGDWTSSYPKHSIGILTVDKACNEFGAYSNFNCDIMCIKDVGDDALSCCNSKNARHTILNLTVEKSGKRLGKGSHFFIDPEKIILFDGVIFDGKIMAENKPEEEE